MCSVNEWGHSQVKGSSQKQGVYEDVCQFELYIMALERETDGGPGAWDRCRRLGRRLGFIFPFVWWKGKQMCR